MAAINEAEIQRGRGAGLQPASRFEKTSRENFDDGWDIPEEETSLRTQIFPDESRTIFAKNESPDIPFSVSVNAYRGCEHGCIYCFARPTHNYFDLSSGLDFESKIFAKFGAARLMEKEFRKPKYIPQTIAMSGVTDIYQPVERRLKITRSLLEVCEAYNHPVALITKNALIRRDIDILSRLAEKNLVRAYVSITSLDGNLARRMEPRASTPSQRLAAVKALTAAGIETGVMLAPQIPFVNDHELEAILAAAAAAGATSAAYITLRLPWDIKQLFHDWLKRHFTEREEKVIAQIRAMHHGKEYEAGFFNRMQGTGQYAEMLGQRFHIAAKRLGLLRERSAMTTALFSRPLQAIYADDGQLSLF
ncbi:MAG: PA0069 family radical SAM protein [Turneriella sp.]|nr:PA0069 family radical SAM protein [Turneriella sp.]